MSGRSPAGKRAQATFSQSTDEAIDGPIGAAGELHPPLRDERRQQLIERLHDAAVAGKLVRTAALDRLDAVLLDVAGDDAGEGAAQIGGELMHGLAAIER